MLLLKIDKSSTEPAELWETISGDNRFDPKTGNYDYVFTIRRHKKEVNERPFNEIDELAEKFANKYAHSSEDQFQFFTHFARKIVDEVLRQIKGKTCS